MSRRFLRFGLTLSAALVVAGAFSVSAQQSARAKATLAGDGITGTVELREVDAQTAGAHDMTFMTGMKAVEITVTVTGLTPGLHGMHLHAKPACAPPDFATAGGHLNPGGKAHGRLNPDGPHLGDLPNLQVGRDGEARLQFAIPGVILRPGPASIGVPGSALILHAGQDDERSDPSGNAGPRAGCAVISVGTP